MTDLYTELSRRCFGLSRDFVKRCVMSYAYGGQTDPWVDHIIKGELLALRPCLRDRNLSIEVGHL
jgi:hypothetical protein